MKHCTCKMLLKGLHPHYVILFYVNVMLLNVCGSGNMLVGVMGFGTTPIITLGTRGSPLALAQAKETKALLQAKFPHTLGHDDAISIKVYKTSGDVHLDVPLARVGGKGLFTKELDEALLKKEVNMCVHSAKDLPTALPAGTVLAAALRREDVRDAFISVHWPNIQSLPPKSVVGSASLRRAAQLLLMRPDLEVVNYRGNLGSRLNKLKEGRVAGTFLALAGLKRLGQESAATQIMSIEEMLPAAGQGAIGLQVRDDDEELINYAKAIGCDKTLLQITAERAFLAGLEGDCRMPIGAHAEIEDSQVMKLSGVVATPDGKEIHKVVEVATTDEAANLGLRAAEVAKKDAGQEFLAKIKNWEIV